MAKKVEKRVAQPDTFSRRTAVLHLQCHALALLLLAASTGTAWTEQGGSQQAAGTVDVHRQGRTGTLHDSSSPATALPRRLVASLDQAPAAAQQQQQQYPKVALLFVTTGPVYHEGMWKAFFRLAKGLQPVALPPMQPTAVDLEKLVRRSLFPPSQPEPAQPFACLGTAPSPPVPSAGKRPQQLSGTSQRRQLKANVIRFDVFGWERDALMAMEKELMPCLQAEGDPIAACSSDDRAGDGDVDILRRQSLFSVYTHPAPGYTFPSYSIFAGTEVAPRVNTTNARFQHALWRVALSLLRAALADPWNDKFVLVSDNAVPLYGPKLIWTQLMVERRSRVNACPSWDTDLHVRRWDPQMETPFLKKRHFRKSSQWFTLDRELAELAVADKHVEPLFAEYCYTRRCWDKAQEHECVSDEHYLPTLIAAYDLAYKKTDCVGRVAWYEWLAPGHDGHARSYNASDVKATMLLRVRNHPNPGCDAAAAVASVGPLLRKHEGPSTGDNLQQQQEGVGTSLSAGHVGRMGGRRSNAQLTYAWAMGMGYIPLSYECPLFARKFPAESKVPVLRMALACSAIGLSPWCPQNREPHLPVLSVQPSANRTRA